MRSAKSRSAKSRSAKSRSAEGRSAKKRSGKTLSLLGPRHGEGYSAGHGAFDRFLRPPSITLLPLALESSPDCEPVQPGFPTRRASLAPGSETARTSCPSLAPAPPRYCLERTQQLAAFGSSDQTTPPSETVGLPHKLPQRIAWSVAKPADRGIAWSSWVNCMLASNRPQDHRSSQLTGL